MPRPTETGTRSYQRVDLLNPDWRAIDLHDVALSLSRIPRFLGQTWRVVSVLEHSLAVACMVSPRYRLAALLHDAREAYLGNITRPAQVALDCRERITGIGRDLDVAIARQVLLPAPCFANHALGAAKHYFAAVGLMDEMTGPVISAADDAACALEIRLFLNAGAEAYQHSPAWDFYSRTEPEPWVLRKRWLADMAREVEARFCPVRVADEARL